MSEEQVSIETRWKAPEVKGIPDEQWESDVIDVARTAIQEHIIRMLMLSKLPVIPDEDWSFFAHKSFFEFWDLNNARSEDDIRGYPLRFLKGDGLYYSGHEFGKKMNAVYPWKNQTDETKITRVVNDDYSQSGLIQVSLFFADGPYYPNFIEHRTRDTLTISLETFDFSKYRQTISTT